MKEKKRKCTSIGGQAVLEGVMMRGKSAMAMAVRDSDGEIQLETKRFKNNGKKNWFCRLPIIRGVVNFFSSMVDGMKITVRSAEVYGEEIEPSKAEAWLAKKMKVDIMKVLILVAVFLGIALSIFLFVLLPQLCASGISALTGLEAKSIWYNLIEGIIRIIIFIIYVWATSLFSDIKRLYMYHGAEHKTITCYEKGLELTTSNASKCSRFHDRCGTAFLFIVMVISILVFTVANSFLDPLYIADSVAGYKIFNFLIRFGIKVALLPLVAGVSYEVLKFLAKFDGAWVKPLKAPGLLMQRLTTKEPDDEMLQVAIAAFNEALLLDGDIDRAEKRFLTATKLAVIYPKIKDELMSANIDESDAEWIVSMAIGIKRSQLEEDRLVTPKQIKKINEWKNARLTGRPLWYIVGSTDFYGCEIAVDERVLIPRPETELLVEEALKIVQDKSKVLDLCTGSGAIAVALAKNSTAQITASDISELALSLAEVNAEKNNADITFVKSNMFENINGKFNLIISNPPYIKSKDIPLLQKEVSHFEPKIALDGGIDGLDFYRILAILSTNYLLPDGVLLVECGIGQAEEIAKMFKGFSFCEIINDLNQIPRIIKAVL